MSIIYKVTIDGGPVQVQRGAKMLHIGEQRGKVTAWFLCDQTAPQVVRKLMIVGTGHEAGSVLDGAKYVGTVQIDAFVWHVFDFGEMASDAQERGNGRSRAR